VTGRKAARPRHSESGAEARVLDGFASHVSAIAISEPRPEQAIIHASLAGCNSCSALGITVTGYAPALALCRELLRTGHEPDRPLHVYRGSVLALKIRSIGEGAGLTVEDDRYGRPRIRRWRERSKLRGAEPVVRPISPAVDQHPPSIKIAQRARASTEHQVGGSREGARRADPKR